MVNQAKMQLTEIGEVDSAVERVDFSYNSIANCDVIVNIGIEQMHDAKMDQSIQ